MAWLLSTQSTRPWDPTRAASARASSTPVRPELRVLPGLDLGGEKEPPLALWNDSRELAVSQETNEVIRIGRLIDVSKTRKDMPVHEARSTPLPGKQIEQVSQVHRLAQHLLQHRCQFLLRLRSICSEFSLSLLLH